MTIENRFRDAVEKAIEEKKRIFRIESYVINGLKAELVCRSPHGIFTTVAHIIMDETGEMSGFGPYGNAAALIPIIKKYMNN